jgi:hypothetical protein
MSEFTVVVTVRQGFGNEPGYLNSIEPQVPFVGAHKTFTFQCPNVKTNEPAVLMFQTRAVSHNRNVLSINGTDVAGGIPVSPSKDTWNGNVMLVAPGVLRTSNQMLVRSRNAAGGDGGDLDDFILDNVVVMYKTH